MDVGEKPPLDLHGRRSIRASIMEETRLSTQQEYRAVYDYACHSHNNPKGRANVNGQRTYYHTIHYRFQIRMGRIEVHGAGGGLKAVLKLIGTSVTYR